MKVLLAGRNGQVGSELQSQLEELGSVIATDRTALDIGDAADVTRVVREVKPDLIVNAAAYTAVDKAEEEPALAMQINGLGPGLLAEEAKRCGALLLHYSTDYVFDGSKTTPYREDDRTRPLGVYGRSKLEGETRIRASACRHLIVRTAWVYGNGGNFVRAILRQAAKGAALRVVKDQLGAPTWARDIAGTTVRLLQAGGEGTFHVSAAGLGSWYEVALEVIRLTQRNVDVRPITTAEYGARAPRPAYSVLDNAKLRSAGVVPIGDWRARLAVFLDGLESGA